MKSRSKGCSSLKARADSLCLSPTPEAARWVKAAQPVVNEYKKDLISKGYSGKEVDSWLAFVKERIDYWKNQEKARKIPTTYEY